MVSHFSEFQGYLQHKLILLNLVESMDVNLLNAEIDKMCWNSVIIDYFISKVVKINNEICNLDEVVYTIMKCHYRIIQL